MIITNSNLTIEALNEIRKSLPQPSEVPKRLEVGREVYKRLKTERYSSGIHWMGGLISPETIGGLEVKQVPDLGELEYRVIAMDDSVLKSGEL